MAGGPEARTQQRDARAVGAQRRLGRLARHVHRRHRRTRRQRDLEERLRAVLDLQLHFGQRPPLGRDERGRGDGIRHRGEHAGVGKALHVEREARRRGGRALVTEGGQRRQPSERLQRAIELAHVDAVHAVPLLRRQLQRSHAFNRDLAALALHVAHRDDAGVERERSRRRAPVRG
jgi:hypothetical protein